MAVFKNTFTRAISVIPSSYCNVPNPALFMVSAQSTSTATNQLIDTAANFITAGVQVGDIVYNTSENLAATVIKVINATTLELNTDAVQSSSSNCNIYAGTQNLASLGGCFLYNTQGSAPSAVVVRTVGGDQIGFDISSQNQLCPIQVIAVISCSNIIALW